MPFVVLFYNLSNKYLNEKEGNVLVVWGQEKKYYALRKLKMTGYLTSLCIYIDLHTWEHVSPGIPVNNQCLHKASKLRKSYTRREGVWKCPAKICAHLHNTFRGLVLHKFQTSLCLPGFFKAVNPYFFSFFACTMYSVWHSGIYLRTYFSAGANKTAELCFQCPFPVPCLTR